VGTLVDDRALFAGVCGRAAAGTVVEGRALLVGACGGAAAGGGVRAAGTAVLPA